MSKEESRRGRLNEEQGRILARLARQTIADELGDTSRTADDFDQGIFSDPTFQEKTGTFVTLKKKGQLRGCIGSLTSSETIAAGVKRNAASAAFGDPRFSPLTREELADIEIEISILTEPQPLDYNDGDDLLVKLRANVDGVILKKGSAGATFLPQVWKQLPRPEDFLSHLCRKAGLPEDAWKTDDLEISTYQVQYFHEKKK